MDWKLPTLKFKHIQQVNDSLGMDLTNLEQLAELDSILICGPVIKLLTTLPPEEFEASFYGENIQAAKDQLMERLEAFFTPEQASILRKMLEAQKAIYQQIQEGAGGITGLN